MATAEILHRQQGLLSNVTATVGKEFMIILPSESGTGRRWEARFDPQHFAMRSYESIPPRTESGAGGAEIFIMVAKTEGEHAIEMRFCNVGEETATSRKVYMVSAVREEGPETT